MLLLELCTTLHKNKPTVMFLLPPSLVNWLPKALMTRSNRSSFLSVIIFFMCLCSAAISVYREPLYAHSLVNSDDDEITDYSIDPILDSSVLPGYILRKSDYCFLPIVAKRYFQDKTLLHPVEKTQEIKCRTERWLTLTEKEEKRIDKTSIQQPYAVMVIHIFTLGSNKDAKNYFYTYYRHPQCIGFTSGSYTGETLGDECSTNNNSLNYKKDTEMHGYKNGLHIGFLKGCNVVDIYGYTLPHINNKNPMAPEFVENIARVLAKRLK